MRVARCIPPDKIDWTYREGQFTLGNLVRHIATINRYMYAEMVSGRPSRYDGCGKELADGYRRCSLLPSGCIASRRKYSPGSLPSSSMRSA